MVTLQNKAQELNKIQFDALHYTAQGTDLMVGLPKNYRFEGAGSLNASGQSFIANMPTEEVFTAPDCRRVDSYVTSTKPLSYAGTTINSLKLTFAAGEVVDFTATQGEVALVPDPSPISQSGITFYNTLFDENASNHLALGAAYAFSVENGTKMTEVALQAAGLNRSQTHVDFMIGSAEMNVDGITQTGQVIPIFKNGD